MGDKDGDYSWADSGREYAIGGKIMLSAIVVLFAVVVLLVALHLYARWYVVRLRRRQIQRRQGQRLAGRSEIIVYLDNWLPAVHRGLDTEVLNSLPVFPYSMSPPPPPSECAVCLSEFEGREIVRHLPKCGHSFHIECIDMWFHSHATCPLCRSPVEPVPFRHPDEQEKEVNNKPEPGSSSDSETADESTTTSLVGRRKALRLAGMNIEVPPRRAEWESESAQSSPAERILPSRRILSTGRRSAATTPSVAWEPDLESALNGSSRSLNRVRTPR